MIYMVDCVFAESARAAAWNAWYDGHVARLLEVPGIESGQRFKAADRPWYTAMYTIVGKEVFESAAYSATRGGAFPEDWRAAVSQWRRTLFAADAPAPPVALDEFLIVADAEREVRASVDDELQWLRPVALDAARGSRGIKVVALPEMPAIAGCGVQVCAPISAYLRASAS